MLLEQSKLIIKSQHTIYILTILINFVDDFFLYHKGKGLCGSAILKVESGERKFVLHYLLN